MDTFSILQNRITAAQMVRPGWHDLAEMTLAAVDAGDLVSARALHSALVASCPINPSHVINPEALAL